MRRSLFDCLRALDRTFAFLVAEDVYDSENWRVEWIEGDMFDLYHYTYDPDTGGYNEQQICNRSTEATVLRTIGDYNEQTL